jgi:hypothetical protein
MSTRIHIEKQDGRMAPASKEVFAEEWAALSDGPWTIDITPGKRGYQPSRYKYYFDAVLWAILEQAGRHYLVTVPGTGEQRPPRNTDEVHMIMKCLYNPVTLQIGRATMTLPGSTTDLSDRDFIGNYLEQIMADHMGAPYLVDFVDYELWKAMHKAGEWKEYKRGVQ